MQGSVDKKVILDTSAWVEYFRGSEEGGRVREFVESEIEIITPVIVVAELSDKFRKKGKTEEWVRHRRQIVCLRSRIARLSVAIADEAGKIKNEMRKRQPDFPLADAMILAIAKQEKARILTGDIHLRGHPQAIDLARKSDR